LRADQVDVIQTMLALAAGTLDEDGLAEWIRKFESQPASA